MRELGSKWRSRGPQHGRTGHSSTVVSVSLCSAHCSHTRSTSLTSHAHSPPCARLPPPRRGETRSSMPSSSLTSYTTSSTTLSLRSTACSANPPHPHAAAMSSILSYFSPLRAGDPRDVPPRATTLQTLQTPPLSSASSSSSSFSTQSPVSFSSSPPLSTVGASMATVIEVSDDDREDDDFVPVRPRRRCCPPSPPLDARLRPRRDHPTVHLPVLVPLCPSTAVRHQQPACGCDAAAPHWDSTVSALVLAADGSTLSSTIDAVTASLDRQGGAVGRRQSFILHHHHHHLHHHLLHHHPRSRHLLVRVAVRWAQHSPNALLRNKLTDHGVTIRLVDEHETSQRTACCLHQSVYAVQQQQPWNKKRMERWKAEGPYGGGEGAVEAVEPWRRRGKLRGLLYCKHQLPKGVSCVEGTGHYHDHGCCIKMARRHGTQLSGGVRGAVGPGTATCAAR